MKKLDKLNNLRIRRAKKFISSLKMFDELDFNANFKDKRHVYHLLSAYYKPNKFVNKNHLIKELYDKYSIKCAVQYYPLYKYDLFKKMGFAKNNCPNTEKFYNNMISFPFHVWMSDKEFNYLISSVKKALKSLETFFKNFCLSMNLKSNPIFKEPSKYKPAKSKKIKLLSRSIINGYNHSNRWKII